ncbi:MAG TPA: septal ring lytic transglycosylase RlpA family protein [Alphaproteobacteria bacterium]|jgi:rare lipoprotein A|nr:septal ring lytic transglycosylase RlpA family protein [Alphaproteobacteria bacterium]
MRAAAGFVLFAGAALLAGCGGGGRASGPASHGPYSHTSAGPTQGYYKVGSPYQIDGVTYTPAVNYNYDETGIASWYGPNFTGKITANGELYDMNEVTAAHRTLPMPSLVRVTNLDNGRSIVVRVNDRGPYARGRILDMSRRGAQLLGYEKTGTAKVRVQIMARESMVLAAAAKQGQLTVDVAGLDNEAPPLPPGTPTYTRPGAAPPPPPKAYVPPPQQVAEAETVTEEQTGAPAPIAVPTVSEKSLIQQDMPQQSVKGSDVGGRFLPAPVATYQKVKPSAIYIQAGAFGVQENAERLKAKLAGVGRADIFVANVDGKTFYRVRVGPVATVDQADELLARVVGAGANGAKIVVN